MAAITAFVKRVIAHPAPPRRAGIRQDMEVRAIEDAMRHAVDHADLERMERAYDRRGAGGWNWRSLTPSRGKTAARGVDAQAAHHAAEEVAHRDRLCGNAGKRVAEPVIRLTPVK